jgi:hypothetical protein
MATTDQLTALAGDGAFRQRVRNLVLLEAAVVGNEVNTTPGHAARSAFAFKVIGSPGVADTVADFLCARTNLTGSTVTYDFSKRAAVTDASDASIRSQIATDWNMLSGIQT